MTKYTNESLKKGLAVLSTVAASEQPIGVTAAADRSDLDYTTTYRLLSTLSDLGYVERDLATKRYSASVGTLRLGYSYLRNNALHKAALPVMHELLAATGETVNLGIRSDEEMVLLASCESDHILGSRPSRSGRYPLHCTASGKVMLAGMENGALHALLRRLPLPALTGRTIGKRDVLLREVHRIRRNGWALNDQEHVLGLVAVAVPILDETSRTVAALDISAPTARVTLKSAELLVPTMVNHAARISVSLGWKPESG